MKHQWTAAMIWALALAAQTSLAQEVKYEMSVKVGEKTVTVPVEMVNLQTHKSFRSLSPSERIKLRCSVKKWRSISPRMRVNAQIPWVGIHQFTKNKEGKWVPSGTAKLQQVRVLSVTPQPPTWQGFSLNYDKIYYSEGKG